MNMLGAPWVDAVDVANAALFLASDEARYITAVTLPVDAGANQRWKRTVRLSICLTNGRLATSAGSRWCTGRWPNQSADSSTSASAPRPTPRRSQPRGQDRQCRSGIERSAATRTVRRAGDPRRQTIAWGNAVVGLRNPVAPPLVIHHEADGTGVVRVRSPRTLRGPPGHVHGGVCSLILDHVLGATAHRPLRPAYTGTLIVRYLRKTELGRPLRAEAMSSASMARKHSPPAISPTKPVPRLKRRASSSPELAPA